MVDIQSHPARGYRVHLETGGPYDADLVLLAVGFGRDGASRPPCIPGDATVDYWDPADIVAHQVRGKVVVAGSGDGGLMDAARAAVADFRHHETLPGLLDDEHGRALARQMAEIDMACIEERRRKGTEVDDLSKRYIDALTLPPELRERFISLPKNAEHVHLVSRVPGIFTLRSALVNRLLVFGLAQVHRIVLRSGEVVGVDGTTCTVQMQGGRRIALQGAQAVLRRGPDPRHLEAMFPEASSWMVPPDRRLEELELTRTLDLDTWNFWNERASEARSRGG